MAKDLTVSAIDRQNILNNPFALEEIQKATNIEFVIFENKAVILKEQVAAFFEVSLRTVNSYLEKFGDELRQNGYEVVKGNRLKNLKLQLSSHFGSEADFITKTTVLGYFDFRSFLNLGMLITESERASLLRKAILDIVIDTLNRKTGGGTKYINQRDEDFIIAFFEEENYRKEYTDALRDFVAMGNFKYPMYTDKIYLSIFNENAKEYRKILNLHAKTNVRDTFYSEILDLVSSYEYGFACTLKEAFANKGQKLSSWEVDELFREFEQLPNFKPLVERARVKMASRDLAAYETLLVELAKSLYLKDHPEKQRVPKGFANDFQLHIERVDEGSAKPLLSLVTAGFLAITPGDYFDKARELITECIGAPVNELPVDFPRELLWHFNQFGRSLRSDESIEFSNKQGQVSSLTQESRKKLVLAVNKVYEKEIELIGSINETDSEKVPARSDPQPKFEEHAVIDFNQTSKKDCRKKAKKLQLRALSRACLFSTR